MMMLTDTVAFGRIAGKLKNQDKGLWEKIKDFFTGLVEKLRNAYQDAEPDSEIAKILKRAIKDNEALAEAWASAVVDAGENYQLQDGQKKNAREGERFSIRNTQNMSWQDQIRGALYGEKTIRRNDTLVAGTVSDFLVNDGVSQKPLAIPLSVLTKASSGKDVSHSIKKGKLAKLDSGIENAPLVIVNPGRNAIVYVTDIKQGGAPLLAAFNMDTEFDGDNVHKATSIHLQIDVQTMLNNLPAEATIYVQNKNELAAVGATNNLRGLAANVKFISEGIISEGGKNVKGNVRYSSRNNRDAEYMELAKDPEKNRERLQKMVEDAAKEAGYTRLFYHGSKKGGGFTQFRDWQYFTENRDYAQRYAERGNENSLYTTFVKMENPFDTRIDAARDIYEDARMEYGMGELLENGLPDWTDGYDIADYIDENDLDYDSIVLDEGGDMVNGAPVSRGLSYVVRKSNQVKYADAVTYDDSGNVIPLSQRFDTANEDIRYSSRNTRDSERDQTETENFKRWFGDWRNDPSRASKVVNEDGTPKVVYHQTAGDFTIFEPRHQGAGTRDSDTPFGIFMKSSDKSIGLNGEKQMALYAKIVNPLTVIDRADLIYQLKTISPEYVKAADELHELNDAYQKKYDDATKAFQDYIVEWRKAHPLLPFRKNLTFF